MIGVRNFHSKAVALQLALGSASLARSSLGALLIKRSRKGVWQAVWREGEIGEVGCERGDAQGWGWGVGWGGVGEIGRGREKMARGIRAQFLKK